MSQLGKIMAEKRKQAADALSELIAALASAGVVLPSAGVEWQSVLTGEVLIDLGRARPDVITLLAKVIRAGAEVLRASDC
ncbi:hypothetical protein P3T36_000139 [Kitasatospora sp. MAP12-15]|uniref:hypothetical protein n=1 Tax=unclassified Kitasatospora TaxID=2633591 RepID=UPI00247721A6|nr:hypothetical protein [Kitasatospora sp. MAP12-44]MDH6109367.1 hypothetical protein [Kitasatospora sp. MAP12-44]